MAAEVYDLAKKAYEADDHIKGRKYATLLYVLHTAHNSAAVTLLMKSVLKYDAAWSNVAFAQTVTDNQVRHVLNYEPKTAEDVILYHACLNLAKTFHVNCVFRSSCLTAYNDLLDHFDFRNSPELATLCRKV